MMLLLHLRLPLEQKKMPQGDDRTIAFCKVGENTERLEIYINITHQMQLIYILYVRNFIMRVKK